MKNINTEYLTEGANNSYKVVGLKCAEIAAAAVILLGMGACASSEPVVQNDTSVVSESVNEMTTPEDSTEFGLDVQSESVSSEEEQLVLSELELCKKKYAEKLKEIIPDDANVSYFMLQDLNEDGLPEIDMEYFSKTDTERKIAMLTMKKGMMDYFDEIKEPLEGDGVLSVIYYRYKDYTIIVHRKKMETGAIGQSFSYIGEYEYVPGYPEDAYKGLSISNDAPANSEELTVSVKKDVDKKTVISDIEKYGAAE
ncbi:MAG: hypothetical protein IIZ59_04130 [Clostridia bacterium]|nr:hypothetical protein [Clostridia bacterium]